MDDPVQVQSIGGHTLPPGLELPATLFWLVLVTNAVNLIDGMDGLATGVALFATVTMLSALGAGNSELLKDIGPILAFAAGFIVYVGVLSILQGYFTASMANLVFGNTRLDSQASFTSTQSVASLAWIYVTNLVAILLTVGLAVPWAVIRMMRYRASTLSFESSVPIDGFVAAVGAPVGAAGEAIGEFFDMDLSL